MLAPEQLAAIFRATGKMPPGYELPPPPPPPPPPPQWLPMLTDSGELVSDAPRKRGRPAGSLGVSKLTARPKTGLSQAKGVNKEVEAYFKERLDELVEQLHKYYWPLEKDGRMQLRRRDNNVSFDGMVARTAPVLPRWFEKSWAKVQGVPRGAVRMQNGASGHIISNLQYHKISCKWHEKCCNLQAFIPVMLPFTFRSSTSLEC